MTTLSVKKVMIRYFFRTPEFPLICDAGNVLIGAVSPEDFEAQMARLDLPLDETLTVIDVSGGNWVFYTQLSTLSPLRRKNGWTKKEVIALFNGSDTAKKLGKQYSDRSLSAKRFDRIFTEIVELIQIANKSESPKAVIG